MSNQYSQTTRKHIIKLYANERLPISLIAKKTGATTSGIRSYLQRINVWNPTRVVASVLSEGSRSTGPRKDGASEERKQASKAWLATRHKIRMHKMEKLNARPL